MTHPVTAGRYRARDGTEHCVLAEYSAAGRWRILDATPAGSTIVDTLAGDDDRLDPVTALARDYAAEQQAYHDGKRLDDPLPKPQPDASEERSCAA